MMGLVCGLYIGWAVCTALELIPVLYPTLQGAMELPYAMFKAL